MPEIENTAAELPAASPPWDVLFTAALVAIGVLLALCLIRAITGRRAPERVIAINMIGTLTVMAIGLLAFLKKEDYLVDVALIYTMLSFLAVVVLSRLSVGAYRAARKTDQEADHDA